jgi:hypothetical protein
MRLSPFLSFYGAKYKAAPKYPKPEYSTIIEPFAGSAGYSILHHERDIRLFDIDPNIVGVWGYLIRSRETTIRRLPGWVENVDDLNVCQEAKWLIGFWLGGAGCYPRKQPTPWARTKQDIPFWSERLRDRIADQLRFIRHWSIQDKSWGRIRNTKATWFVDPPYQNECGRQYRHSEVDFQSLGQWCRNRRGQVIACEQKGANWLPFTPFIKIKSAHDPNRLSHSEEVIWQSTGQQLTPRTKCA